MLRYRRAVVSIVLSLTLFIIVWMYLFPPPSSSPEDALPPATSSRGAQESLEPPRDDTDSELNLQTSEVAGMETEDELEKSGSIRGHVFDEQGEPIAGAVIHARARVERSNLAEPAGLLPPLDDRDFRAVSGNDGHFELRSFDDQTGAGRAVLTADQARLDQANRFVTARGNAVLVVVEIDREIRSEEIHYDPERNRVWSDSATCSREGDKVVEGSGFSANLEFTLVEVTNPRSRAGGDCG